MTDKEFKEEVRDKTDELIEKFNQFVIGEFGSRHELYHSKKCAEIVAQQILDLDVVWYRKEAVGKPLFIRPEMTREFWEEVMNELNK